MEPGSGKVPHGLSTKNTDALTGFDASKAIVRMRSLLKAPAIRSNPEYPGLLEKFVKNALSKHRHRKLTNSATALFTFAICLSSTTLPALAQAVHPPTTDPRSPTEPTHTVVPVHLDPATGDIKIGRTNYPGANPGLHLLALQRQPDSRPAGSPDSPVLISDEVVTSAASANQFLQTVLSNPLTKDAVLIVNGVGNFNVFLSDIAKNLEAFGGQVDLEPLQGTLPFVFIGNGGRNKGSALQRGYSAVPVDGYLARDPKGNYTFLQTDFVRYDISLDGTIKVGNATYDVARSYKPGVPRILRTRFTHLFSPAKRYSRRLLTTPIARGNRTRHWLAWNSSVWQPISPR